MVSENDELNETTDGGKLRKMYEDALKKNKEMSDKLASLESSVRTQSVEKTLAEKGLSPKLAKFVSAEDGSDPARLDAWIKDNAELFGAGTAPVDVTPGAPSVDGDVQNAFNQIQQVSQTGAHAVTDVSALVAQIKNAKNPAELEALKQQYR